VLSAYKQCDESIWHVTYDTDPWHVFPVVVQLGSTLHVHAAEPAEPVQLWRVPHAVGVPYARQPSLPTTHEASPPKTHDFCPVVQLSVHTDEHAAFGALPEHVCGLVHVDVDATYRQPFVSVAHVATVWLFWHTVPVSVHGVAAHAHEALPPEALVQTWWALHVAVVTHAAQPSVPTWHVCTPVLVHCVAPALHVLTHGGASLASAGGTPVSGIASPDSASQASRLASEGTVESIGASPSAPSPTVTSPPVASGKPPSSAAPSTPADESAPS
jgi:hypothetical protein